MAKITFVVAEIIFKVAVITSSQFSGQDHTVMAWIIFEVAVINSSVANIIFVVAEVTYTINISEKYCWYTLKKR